MKNNLFLNERNINLIVKIVYIIDNSKRFFLKKLLDTMLIPQKTYKSATRCQSISKAFDRTRF